jgi:phenylacetate-CoA ligase
VNEFNYRLENERISFGNEIPETIVRWISTMKERSLWFKEILSFYNWEKHFAGIKIMTRRDLQVNLDKIVPLNEDLQNLIINPTSGTSGQPILAPNHPRAVGCYDPLIQFALRRYDVNEEYDHPRMAAIQICSQKRTITYNTVHSYLRGAGFAKINLELLEWPSEESPAAYIKDLSPVFLSGDPYSFLQSIEYGIDYQPKALLSTSLELSDLLRAKLKSHYKCPVIDFYSLNETGPIAYGCPDNPGEFHILPFDIFTEVVDNNGEPLPEGQTGELLITGGRNPYIPLLRYRTGDMARIRYGACECGDNMPRIKLISARKMIVFEDSRGKPVNPVDIPRILKDYPLGRFWFLQKKDLSCVLNLLPNNQITNKMRNEILQSLKILFGENILINIEFEAGENQPAFIRE